uniref:Uncharacterized protein n=1 Tax=Panagrolaimus sp. ES5 TaxID=591445 RepID=A0AC34GEY4_9BILA
MQQPPQDYGNPMQQQQQPPQDYSNPMQHQQVVNAALTNPFGSIQQNAQNLHSAGVSPAVATPEPPSYPAPPSDQSTPNPSPVLPYTNQQSTGSEPVAISQQSGQTLGIYEQTPFSGSDSSYTSPSHFQQQMQQQQPPQMPPQ